ncbi:hypothetical protein L1019_23280, partial [Escherichia coli]|nr:hypothetical protein [Escherichia coli]
WKGWAILLRQKQKKLIMLPSETMIWQPEFTDKILSRKPGAVQSVADLTFGEYIRLFENPELWKKTELQIDKKIFTKELDKVRIIRNDVMHFDPDGISEENHELLHNFVRFIHTIQSLSRK